MKTGNDCLNDEIKYVTANLKLGLYLNTKTGQHAWVKKKRWRQVYNFKKKRLEHGHWYDMELENGQKGDNVYIAKKDEKNLVYIGKA